MIRTGTVKQLNKKEIRLLLFTAFALLLALLAWLTFSPQGILANRNLRHQVEQIKVENERLTAENRSLREKLETIEKNPSFMEEVARDEYNLLKKNETLFEFNR